MYRHYPDILQALGPSYKPLQLSESASIEQYPGISVLAPANNLQKLFIHKDKHLPLYKNSVQARIYQVRLLEKLVIQHSTGKREDLEWNLPTEAVIEILGPPDLVRHKTGEQATDFFYTYFSEGIDLLFAGTDYLLSKIIMHTNLLEDIVFGEYERCNFVISTRNGDVNPQTRFSEAVEKLEGEPGEIGIRRHTHGFRPTQYFKYPGAVFEVLHTGYIASVTISYF